MLYFNIPEDDEEIITHHESDCTHSRDTLSLDDIIEMNNECDLNFD